MHWLTASALSALTGAVYIVCLAYLVKVHATTLPLPHALLGLYTVALVALGLYLVVAAPSTAAVQLALARPSGWALWIGAGVAFVASTLCFAYAFRHAPHPGYVTSIANTNALLVLAFGVLVGGKLVAGARWNPMAVLGVVVTFVGLGLVAVYGEGHEPLP